MSITFRVSDKGVTFRADTTDEATSMLQSLKREKLLNGNGLASTDCDPEKCQAFLNSLNERQADLLSILAKSEPIGSTDEELRSRFKFDNNQVLTGFLSQIQRKSKKAKLGDWYTSTPLKKRGQPKRYRYRLVPQFLTVFREHLAESES